MSINARRDGEGYILEGEATCIINAGVSTLYFVFASASGTNICGVLPSSIPGLQISSPISKLGLSVTPYADIKLDSVFLKDDLILAADSEANHLLNNTDIRRQNLVAAAAVGCTRAVLRESVAYANQRQKGGKLIAKHDAVATMLGEMQTGLKSSQALVNTALKSDCELETAVAARIHATDIACEASLNAVQVFGGYGYMVDLPVEKLMRDSQQLALIGGSNPWLRVYSGGLVSG
jgi:acyl-CoA dehydrogenase